MVKCMCQHALSRRFLDSQCPLAKCFVFFFAAAAPKKRQVPLGPQPYDSGPFQQILLVLLLTQKWQFFKLKTKGRSQKIPEFSNLRTHVLLFLCVLFDGEEKVRKGLSTPTSFESFFGGLLSLSKIKSGLICGLTPPSFSSLSFRVLISTRSLIIPWRQNANLFMVVWEFCFIGHMRLCFECRFGGTGMYRKAHQVGVFQTSKQGIGVSKSGCSQILKELLPSPQW